MDACVKTQRAYERRDDDESKRAFNAAATYSVKLMLADEVIPRATLRARYKGFCHNNGLDDDDDPADLDDAALARFGIQSFLALKEGRFVDKHQVCVRGFQSVDLIYLPPQAHDADVEPEEPPL